MKKYVSLFLLALMFGTVVSAGCGGGSDSSAPEQTESLNENTSGEDTGDYDPNEDGRGNTGGTSDTIRVIVDKPGKHPNVSTRFYARKAGGKWEALLNDYRGKFYTYGSVSETLYIDESYVEFGFEFDVSWGYNWPYSGVFWTADQSRSEKVDAIYIYMSGVRYFPRINIYVNGNLILCKESDSHGTQYNWD